MSKQDRAIGFIGIGSLGKGLAMSLAARQYRVVAAHSRSPSSAQWLADRLPDCRVFASAQELADSTDLVFITTPDSVIGEIAAGVAWRSGQGVTHCCGAASLEILQPTADKGAVTGAFHPFQTFAGLENPEETMSRLEGVTFAVAGQEWLSSFLSELAYELGGRPVSIPAEDRPLYHAAATLGCGYLVTLLHSAVSVWQAMGFSPQEAMEAIYPMSRVTLETAARIGTSATATGPAVRGDAATIRSHLEALSRRLPELVPLHRALTEASLPLAAGRGVSPAQLAALRELIDLFQPEINRHPEARSS